MRVRTASVLLSAILGACAASPAPSASPATSSLPPTGTPTVTQPASPSQTPTAAPSLPGPVDHVFVVIEENHAYQQVVGSAAAPYINELIATGALATNYHAVTHPSLPNYLALFGGSTFGVTSDCQPSARGCHFGDVSLPDRLEAVGLSWRGYFDHMPAPCTATDSGSYRVHHDPFLYFDRIAAQPDRCAAHVVPLERLATDLDTADTTPNLAVIVPGNDHNMHDGSVRAADTWLRQTIALILASPAWSGGRAILILTFDEDDGSATNQVATVFYGSAARAGYRSSVTYTHYSLLRTLEDWMGVSPMTANDRAARPMSDLVR